MLGPQLSGLNLYLVANILTPLYYKGIKKTQNKPMETTLGIQIKSKGKFSLCSMIKDMICGACKSLSKCLFCDFKDFSTILQKKLKSFIYTIN